MSKQNKTKNTFNKNFVTASNKYDGTNYIYDGVTDMIYSENDLKRKYELEEKKKDSISQRRELSNTKSDTKVVPKMTNNVNKPKVSKVNEPFIKNIVPMTMDISQIKLPSDFAKEAAQDNTIDQLILERNKPSKEFFQGLGKFFYKKF